MIDGDDAATRCVPQRKLNCWEFMRCGREPGGQRAAEKGVCPVAVESRLDGVLGGMNAGRCCWAVAGTVCRGARQGTLAKRFASCKECAFFKRMQAEELPFLRHAGPLLLYLSSAEAEQRERDFEVLKALIDPAVIKCALDDPSVLETRQEKHVTAFFSDLAGFSAIAERLDPEQLARFLNEYLSEMTEILKAEGGTLDKYIGDGIVSIFGAPAALENDALSAARAALRMQQRLSELRSEWRRRGAWCPEAWSLQMRIGLSSGCAKVGFMGNADFVSYTMTGATVNLGMWLERTCKTYRVPILVSEETRNMIASEMVLRRIGAGHPKGKVGSEPIYELLGPHGTTPPELVRAAEVYEAALELHDAGRWNAAARLLRHESDRHGPRDRAAERLLRRCERRAAEQLACATCNDRSRPPLIDIVVRWLGATNVL
jgi:class 3 adenylate cyclase